jgi:hypothetical protein
LYDYSPNKEVLHEVRKRAAAILTRPTEAAIDVILILQNGEELTPVTISIVGTDSKLRTKSVGGTGWAKKFDKALENFGLKTPLPEGQPPSLGNPDVKPPSLGILQQFGTNSSRAKFISDSTNCLDLRGLDPSVYRLFEGNDEDSRRKVFKLLNKMLSCSTDILAKRAEKAAMRQHLPVMYKAWAEESKLLPPPTEERADVAIPDKVAFEDTAPASKGSGKRMKSPGDGNVKKKRRSGS